jgi:hypothetical protein
MELLKERVGMQIYRDGDTVVKIATDGANQEALHNSWRFLKLLEPVPYAPKPISLTGDTLRMGFIEADTEPSLPDIEEIRMNAVKFMYHLRKVNAIHGDLTHVNFIIRNNIPVGIDWDQAIFSWEPKPQKRPNPDVHHLYTALTHLELDPSRVLRRWLNIRAWAIPYYLGWGTLVDLGTHRGDFCGLAAAEGMFATGFDNEQIRPCIEDARKYWAGFSCEFRKNQIEDISGDIRANVILLLSTWPYIVRDKSLEIAERVLRDCITNSDVFVFETQLRGDGPGPEFLKTLDDVEELLVRCGATDINQIITIPVGGRDAGRTLFAVCG